MPDTGLSIEIADGPAAADVAEIERRLMAYNAHRAGRPCDRKPLAVFLRAGGALVGGLTGHTDWGWLYIDCFWLAEELRGGGWGSRLLDLAEFTARERGCRHVRLYTYDFQAPDFYRRRGYDVFGVLDGCPPGHRLYWLRKDLD